MTRDHERLPVSLLITDFDNTLYDWFAVWHSSFSALLDSLVQQSGVPLETLITEIRQVHQRRGTSEYSYLLNEIPSLRMLHPGRDMAVVYSEAIKNYRIARRANIRLYPGVIDTLNHARRCGVPVVIYTESLAYHAADRIRRLNLDGIVDYLYSPADHDFPAGISPDTLRSMSAEHYRLTRTVHHHTSAGVFKPDPLVLNIILNKLGVAPERTLYVGDSPIKDIAMAKKVGAIDVLAQYGASYNRTEYDLLRQVSHWSDQDVERERLIAQGGSAEPSFILHRDFSELTRYFEFRGADG